MNIDEEIGKKLRQLRESRNYSLDDLAKLVEKHRSTLHLYEIGKVSISIPMLKRILDVYDENIAKFLDSIMQ